jgi:hypothetical protein
MTSKLPLLNKPFNEQPFIMKFGYITSMTTAIIAILTAFVHFGAYASEKLDGRVLKLVNEHAYEAVLVKVSGELNKIQESFERSRLTQQIGMDRMELRFIKGEIKDITRNAGDSLDASQQAEVDQLRDDRKILLEEIKELRDEQQKIGD